MNMGRRKHSGPPAFRKAAPFLIAAIVPGSAGAQAVGEATVQDVIVTGSAVVEKAEEAVDQIPGGAGVVGARQFETGRVRNAADVLQLEPGVYAQSTSGNDAIRISIRGSGVQRSPLNFGAGILGLLDGLPLLTSTGLPFELVEPLAVSHVDVYRGANAFEFGALTLGGAINYVTRTGYDAAAIQGRFEAGSFGYLRGQVSSGQVVGPYDYYVTGTGFRQDGFRDHSTGNTSRFIANVGYHTPDFDTRFFFQYAHNFFEFPAQLTQAQLDANPRQPNPTALAFNWYKLNPASLWVANKSTLRLDGSSQVEFGVRFMSFPTKGPGGPFVTWDASDISGSVRYIRTDDLAGHRSKTTLALLSTIALNPAVQLFSTLSGGRPGTLLETVNFGGGDVVLLGSNDLEIVRNLWLTTGLSLNYSPRQSNITYPISDNLSKDFFNYAPRVGLRYDVTPDLQLFANGSRSVEPPTNWSFPLLLLPANLLKNLDLKEQTAWTAEVGTRGRAGIFQWSLSYYYSWIRNELLTVTLPNSVLTATSNATPTYHQGVELGLNTVLWQSGPSGESFLGVPGPRSVGVAAAPNEPLQTLTFNQVYTYNDFHFVDDPLFRNNRLPSLPVHIYRGELLYAHPAGFYAGVNVESVFTQYPVDYANTLYSRPYAIVGAKIGYLQPKEGWEIYLEGRNLADVKYAAVVSPIFNAQGRDSAVFYPGDGRAVYGGVAFRF